MPAYLALLACCLLVLGVGCATAQAPRPFDVQGHRGARGLLPENTLPAFQRALELSVTTLELDLAVSADGQVVVSHEPWMHHALCLAPGGARIPEAEEREHNLFAMPYAEIARYDCGSLGHPRFPRQEALPARKPLLDSVFAEAEHYGSTHGSTARYNVEIKTRPEHDGVFHPPPEPFAALVLEVIRRHGVAERTTVQSFDPRALNATHALAPELSLSYLTDEREPLNEALARLDAVPAVYSPYHVLVDRPLVEAAHARGMQVIPWTVNDAGAMLRLAALGVDGLITDYPDVAREAGLLGATAE